MRNGVAMSFPRIYDSNNFGFALTRSWSGSNPSIMFLIEQSRCFSGIMVSSSTFISVQRNRAWSTHANNSR